MIQCNAGHFFDETKHSGCPYCGVPLDLGPAATRPLDRPPLEAQKTVPLRPSEPVTSPAPKTVPLQGSTAPVSPQGATRRLVREQIGMDPVVGWLVCLEGPDRGRDFRLHSEKNFIGRDPSMDLCLTGDDAISRVKHATVSFEPKKRVFWLIPGESSGLVYCNGEVCYTPVPLKDRDVIELGKTKLLLVPFVDERFSWQE